MFLPSFLIVAALCLSATAHMEPGTIPRAAPESLRYAQDNAWSNAQRLANGLPPLGPKYRVTPSFGARRAASSPATTTYTGHFGVRSSSGKFLGYLSGTSAGIGGLTTPGSSNQLFVVLTKTSTNSDPQNIRVTNPSFSPAYIGAQGTVALSSTSANAVVIGNVAKTTALSVPSSGGESTIWFINTRTKELTVQWTNPDGSSPSTFAVYNSALDRVFLTGDVAAYNASTSGALVAVRLFVSG